MLICPVCRSQNMDTAKFCGNCGNPFPRPAAAATSSSLVNCAQGHVYSAVYEHCPYCPQPESRESDFVTRVEEPITTVDPPGQSPYIPSYSPNDFATRIDSKDTLFETSESPVANPITPAAPPTPVFAPTEVVTAVGPPDSIGLSSAEAFRPAEPIAPAPPPLVGLDEMSTQTTPSPAVSAELDRRTTVMADQASQLRKSKGRIVGWLVTYSHNPDGEDHRVYAGYNRIGANPVCDILLGDETVSGSHAIIVYRDGRCLIKDDLSRNGTFVNGREITEAHPLQSYDQIRIGNTYLTFVAAQRIS